MHITYIEKEKKIIQKLKNTNYELFDGDKDDALDFISDKLDAFPNYANIVINQQIVTPIIYERYEGQEIRDRIEDLDKKRRSAHEQAIDGLNILNKLSNNLGLEPFAKVDTSDRYKVADFVGEYVSQVYALGQGKSLDDVTLNKKQSYDLKSKQRLAELDAKFGDIIDNNLSENEVEK